MSALTKTTSICPVCLNPLQAQYTARDNRVWLEKSCPRHGEFSTKVWGSPEHFAQWRRPKVYSPLPYAVKPVDKGCPFDCGLCANHKQRSCTVLLEITHSCNLNCPVCFADAGKNYEPDLAQIAAWYQTALKSNPKVNIQLSGGEPSLRDDLPEIIALGRQTGIDFIQLNTNGLRLAREPLFVQRLAKAGLSSVFLQFDGANDAVYRQIRGRDLLALKCRAIENCGKAGLSVVLTPTLVPGINTGDIGNIINFALNRTPTVKGVHFQPVSYFGRYPQTPGPQARISLAELAHAIETQTGGLFQSGWFNPPGCEHALCSMHANFVILSGDRVLSLNHRNCCGEPCDALESSAKAVKHTARKWRGPGGTGPGEFAPRKFTLADEHNVDMDDFLERAGSHSFMLSAMAFMDAWTLDLNRLGECCVHIINKSGHLVPFCAYNLTSSNGEALYRYE